MKTAPPQFATDRESAFTMVEIAISLAVIGFALVAIIGVLPLGMNVQCENREQTIINQDAAYLTDAIRSGARGLDSLTRNVMGITIVSNSQPVSYLNPANPPPFALPNPSPFALTSAERIIGLLGTPQPAPAPSQRAFTNNSVVAYVRALSGPAVDEFPQNNAGVRQDAFCYRLRIANLPVALSGQDVIAGGQLSNNLRELRLTFCWPLLPNGTTGKGRQTFCTLVGGRSLKITDAGQSLYFFRPQTFAEAP